MERTARRSNLEEVGRALVQSMRANAWHREQRNTHRIVQGSPAYERHRAACSRGPEMFPPGMVVKMFDDSKECVGQGVVSGLEPGDMLEGERLHPIDIGILVTEVYKPSAPVREIFKDILGSCLRCTIRWPRRLVRGTTRYATENGPDAQRVFDFSEDTPVTTRTADERPSQMSGRAGPSTGEGPSIVESNDSPIPGFQCPMEDGLRPTEPRRPYVMSQRVAAERRAFRVLGEARNRKVTLHSVQCAVNRSKCAQKCLRKIPEEVILNCRYNAWKSNTYADRRKWILAMLREAKVESSKSGGRVTFVTKIDGHMCCNSCYADAIGYSQRQFSNLKRSIRMHNRTSGSHGNSGRSREHSNVAACRAVMDNFFKESGCCQPHRHAKRLSDGQYLPLVLLPMNTKREDVLLLVNCSVAALGATKKVSKARFDRLWAEFTHVHIPPTSRFSKCQICWEYRECMDAMPNEWQRHRIRESYEKHMAIQIEERRDYWEAKRIAITNPDEMLCLIVDGMDQNTTMVPKFRQSVKGIEGRYVKTHLCGVLVHGLALYCHVWLDAHHKHDSNQVVTSIVRVLGDVRSRRGTLARTLRIQADNCSRENKNKYMFAFCSTLVALGHFREVQLSFLIVGHTHEDIDQRFSVISNVLKRQDIMSLKQMLELVESGGRNGGPVSFTSAELLENIWDWSGFITNHLHTGSNAWAGTRAPHHFRFYVQNNEARVQYKIYCNDVWAPEGGYSALRSVLTARAKPGLAEVLPADPREVSSLDEFIAFKERQVSRRIHVTENVEAIVETEWLKAYIQEFPMQDRTAAMALPFWPNEVSEPNRPELGTVAQHIQPQQRKMTKLGSPREV